MGFVQFRDLGQSAADMDVTVKADAVDYLMPDGPAQTRVQLRSGRMLRVGGSVDEVRGRLEGENSGGRLRFTSTDG